MKSRKSFDTAHVLLHKLTAFLRTEDEICRDYILLCQSLSVNLRNLSAVADYYCCTLAIISSEKLMQSALNAILHRKSILSPLQGVPESWLRVRDL